MVEIKANINVPLKNFNLKWECDQQFKGVTGITGHSGAGKSSLLQAIAGFQKKGVQLRVDGESWQSSQKGLVLPSHKRRIAYIFQQPYIFPNLTVQENLVYGMKRAKIHHSYFENIVEIFEIKKLLEHPSSALSGGEKQRVALARGALTKPKMWLLDEPLSAVDEDKRWQLLHILKDLFKENDTPVFYVSHAKEEINFLASQVLEVKHGFVSQSKEHQGLNTTLKGRLLEVDQTLNQSKIDIDGHPMILRDQALPLGSSVCIRLDPKQVNLSLDKIIGSTIINQLPCSITQIKDEDGFKSLVTLSTGSQNIHSLIPRNMVSELNLCEGMKVVAILPNSAFT